MMDMLQSESLTAGGIHRREASMTSSAKIVQQHLVASRERMQIVLRSKNAARKFLTRAGIATKQGNRLAKVYR